MNYSGGHCVRSRRPTLPPISNRTLPHPSFLPLYVTADFPRHRMDCNNQTVHPIIPAEFFYSDPTMSCGRIPNIVSELRVIDCFQLNTPPPIMSACPAPPARRDPFRSGPYPSRDLGSLAFQVNTHHPPVQSGRVVLQLTQEEDEAITNLLKLHHQEPMHTPQKDLNPIPFLSQPEPVDCTSAEEAYAPLCSDAQHPREASSRGQSQRGRRWSDTELEAANTLLSRFSPMKDKIQGQNHKKSAATPPDPPQHQRQGPERSDGTQNDICFSHAGESEQAGRGDLVLMEGRRNADDVHLPVREECLTSSLPARLPSASPDPEAKRRSSVSGDFSEVKARTLSDSEGDAVHVLLCLGDMGVWHL